MSPDIIRHPSRDAMAEAVAALLADRLRSLTAQGRARIALPGGTTPGPMLAQLGRAELPWSRVVVTLTDERWVPTSSDRSNQRLLSKTLFAGPAAAAEFVPLYGGKAEPEDALSAINATLEQLALPLDVAVLGMGADMHTASLFPGAVGLDAALAPDAPPASVIRAAGADEPRITLAARILAAAPLRLILLTGADKREALDRALDLSPREAPIRAVLDGAQVHHAD